MEIFTIGFTKTTAEDFFGRLRSNRIERVLDVRLNNRSQLAGFAKRDDLAFFLRELIGASYEHAPLLAPTEEILQAYKRKGAMPWSEYEDRFLALMRERRIESKLDRASLEQRTVLLCSEDTPDRCHRRLVAEYLAECWEYRLHPVAGFVPCRAFRTASSSLTNAECEAGCHRPWTLCALATSVDLIAPANPRTCFWTSGPGRRPGASPRQTPCPAGALCLAAPAAARQPGRGRPRDGGRGGSRGIPGPGRAGRGCRVLDERARSDAGQAEAQGSLPARWASVRTHPHGGRDRPPHPQAWPRWLRTNRPWVRR